MGLLHWFIWLVVLPITGSNDFFVDRKLIAAKRPTTMTAPLAVGQIFFWKFKIRIGKRLSVPRSYPHLRSSHQPAINRNHPAR